VLKYTIFANDWMGWSCNTYDGEEKRIEGFGWIPEGKRLLPMPVRTAHDNLVNVMG
jgi:hypothetical protein